MCGPFSDPAGTGKDKHDLRKDHPPEQGTVDLTASYSNGSGAIQWSKVSSKTGNYSAHLAAAAALNSTYALFDIQSRGPQRIWLEFSTDGAGIVWQNGRSVWFRHRRRNDTSTEGKIPLALQPGTNQFLVRCQPGAKRTLLLSVRALDQIAIVVPEPENATLAERLTAATSGTTSVDLEAFLKVDWNKAATKGNIANGRKLFASIGCAKCHAVSGSVIVTGGPSLEDVGRRFSPDYLVESVLLPSKKISAFFRSSTVVTVQGKVLTGLITAETDTEIELLLPDANRVVIKKDDIEERKEASVSAMPDGLVKTPDELMDVLSFLLSDQ